MMHALTHSQVKGAKPTSKPYKLTDGGRLYLLVTTIGSKLWRWNYRLDGKDHTFAIGNYPSIALAEAREKRDAAQKLVRQGIHPLQQKKLEKQQQKAESASTFKALGAEWIDHNKSAWSPSYLKQVERFMGRYVFETMVGEKPIRQVTASDIRAIITSVAKRTTRTLGERKDGAPSVAILLRQWCGAIFCYAVSFGKAETDPTFALRKGVIIKSKVKNNRALNAKEIQPLLNSLQNFTGLRATGIAIELLLLTFVRTVELRKATWNEFDLEAKTWVIPSERMKMKDQGDHVVPLSAQVIALLKELKTIHVHQPHDAPDWLFPNIRRPDDCLSPTTINRALERMGMNGNGTIGFSAHGFRGTASTMLHERNFRSEVIEAQLAHKGGNAVKAAYNKAKYLGERTLMMQQWADMIDNFKSDAKLP